MAKKKTKSKALKIEPIAVCSEPWYITIGNKQTIGPFRSAKLAEKWADGPDGVIAPEYNTVQLNHYINQEMREWALRNAFCDLPVLSHQGVEL